MPGLRPWLTVFGLDRFEKNKDGALHVPEGGHITWMAIFVDLQFVAMLSKLCHMLQICNPSLSLSSFKVIGLAFSIFNIFFVMRQDFDEYMSMFANDDWFTQAVYFLYQYSLLIMNMNSDMMLQVVPGSQNPCTDIDDDNALNLCIKQLAYKSDVTCVVSPDILSNFTYGFFGSRILLVLLYFFVIYRDQSGKVIHQFIGRTVIFTSSSCLLLFGTAVTKNTEHLSTLLFAVSAMEMLGVLLFESISWLKLPYNRVSIHLDYEPIFHRLGMFILLVLGESVIIMLSLSSSVMMTKNDFYHLVDFGGLLLLYSTSQQYFERVMSFHATTEWFSRKNQAVILIFVYLHSVLGFSVFIIAQGLVQISDPAGGEKGALLARRFLSYGCFSTALILEFLNYLINESLASFCSVWNIFDLFIHMGFAVAHLSLNVAPENAAPGSYVLMHGIIAMLTVCFEFAYAHIRPSHDCHHVNDDGHGHGTVTHDHNRDQPHARSKVTPDSNVPTGHYTHGWSGSIEVTKKSDK